MKKIINNPSNFVDETIDGLIKSHPNIYSLASDNSRVITRAIKSSNKVGLVTGGGSGHLPVFTGYIGKGLLDSCAIGSVFASPSVEQIASAIRNANNGNGVLCILGNYGGDVMNFEMACEIVKDEGIETKTVIVADDIASAKPEEKEKRRGIAGMIFVFKVAGALAETGASLEDVYKIANVTNSNIRTLGVALSPCILPEAGKPTFEINDDEIEIISKGKSKSSLIENIESSRKKIGLFNIKSGKKDYNPINMLDELAYEENNIEQKKEIIALNKIEIADQKRVEEIKKEFESSLNQEVKLISAATGHQLDQLTNLCLEYLQDE